MGIKNRKILFSRKEFNEIYSKIPRLCVDILIIKTKKVLLVERKQSPYKGLWHIPGGTVFLHETLEDAVKRIAKEELDIKINSVQQVGVMEFLHEGNGRHAVSIVYSVEVFDEIKSGSLFKILPINMIEEQRKFLVKNYKFGV